MYLVLNKPTNRLLIYFDGKKWANTHTTILPIICSYFWTTLKEIGHCAPPPHLNRNHSGFNWLPCSVIFSTWKYLKLLHFLGKHWHGKCATTNCCIVIIYKVYNEQHPRAGLNIQHVIYKQLARAGQNT